MDVICLSEESLTRVPISSRLSSAIVTRCVCSDSDGISTELSRGSLDRVLAGKEEDRTDASEWSVPSHSFVPYKDGVDSCLAYWISFGNQLQCTFQVCETSSITS